MRLIDADKLDYMLKLARVSTSTSITDEGLKLALSFIKDMPTVKAIPIELIEKEMKRLDEDIKWAWYYGNVALDKMEYLKTWLTIKLEDWEKENDKNI